MDSGPLVVPLPHVRQLVIPSQVITMTAAQWAENSVCESVTTVYFCSSGWVTQPRLACTQGLRLIMASDGLWDLVSFAKAAKSCRNKLPHQAVASLVQVCRCRRGMSARCHTSRW